MSIQQKITAALINQHKLSNCNITKNKRFLKLQKMAKSNKVNKGHIKDASYYKTSDLHAIYTYIYIYIDR